MIRCLALAILVVQFTVGCSNQNPTDRVSKVSEDDPKMNAAIKQARETVNTFIEALQSPKSNQSDFSVKMAFTDGKNTEHIWLMQVKYDGQKFQGLVANDVELVKNVKFGQSATVAPDQISDWMFVQDRKLVGGSTLRVLRESLSPKERDEFDKSVPFVVE